MKTENALSWALFFIVFLILFGFLSSKPSNNKTVISFPGTKEEVEVLPPPCSYDRWDRPDFVSDLMQCYRYSFEDTHTILAAATRNKCYDLENVLILFAIRKAENGGPGLEFGVMHPKAKNTNLDIQAGWAAATIVKNRKRWEDAGSPGSFFEFLGDRYAPIDAENDPNGLNNHWVDNVIYWTEQGCLIK